MREARKRLFGSVFLFSGARPIFLCDVLLPLALCARCTCFLLQRWPFFAVASNRGSCPIDGTPENGNPFMLYKITQRWAAALLATAFTACLSAPPLTAPLDRPECKRAHVYSQQAHTEISRSYRRTNGILGGVGIVLWFGFVEALAIPVIGIPISYYQHQSLARENIREMEKSCQASAAD